MTRSPISIIAHPRSDRGDHARRLMPENPRRREQVVLDLLEIGVADPAAFHPDQQFSGPDGGRGYRFHRNRAVAGIHGGLHRWRARR